MLDTLLKTTKLTERAFQPKPKDFDLLKNSEQFWRENYQILDTVKGLNHFYTELRQKHAEIDQLFETLIEAIKNLKKPYKLLEESTEALEGLKGRYWHPLFGNYREHIKKQLEIIAYFLITNHDYERKVLVVLDLSETNVCAEGCYSKLQKTIDELNNKVSLSSWLTNLRREIIQRYVSSKHNSQAVHHFNAILTYAQKIGLNVVNDDITYHQLKKDQYIQPLSENEKNEFKDFFCSQYNTRTIIEYITEQLQLEAKQSLAPFQKQIPPFGLVIPMEINFSIINDNLIRLPFESYNLFNIIEENGNYFQFKSTIELKDQVILHLLEKNILKKQSKTFILNGENWEFNTIHGDCYGDYGFIAKAANLYHQEKYPLSAFEEKKLYQYVSLEQFQLNKAFFNLGQNAFNYFYEQKANFSNCYLIDIDFKELDADFISKLYDTDDQDACFIRAKLTYKQLLCFYKLKKYHTLNNSYLVTITNAQQFFNIITEIVGPDKKEQSLFLERHKAILTANNLHLEILHYLNDKKIKKEKELIDAIKKINFFDEYIMLFLSTETPLFIIGFILLSLWLFYYLPLIYCSISLIFSSFLIPIVFILFDELQDNPDLFNYKNKLEELRREEQELLILDKKMLEFSKEQEKIALAAAENNEDKTTSAIAHSSLNPTSISTLLLKGQEVTIKDEPEETLTTLQTINSNTYARRV